MKIKSAAVGLLCALAAALAPAEESGLRVDQNSDGKPDQWIEQGEGGRIFIRSDRNFDGVVDYQVEMDRSERKIFEEFDFNYDGKMDDFYYYRGGELERQEVDSDFDGRIDIWVFLLKGIYVRRIERDTDGDGKADQVIDYEPKK